VAAIGLGVILSWWGLTDFRRHETPASLAIGGLGAALAVALSLYLGVFIKKTSGPKPTGREPPLSPPS
jgi:hypothetical protein